ncbi:MAG TPA: hypothetical protein VMR70_17685 [Flavisolibacter sp.]|nr:hypothetical protein [Flavisolibacter sp.]
MQNAILYQAYGGVDFVNECRYSLLKYLQVYNLKPPPDTGIYIYTDQPHLFADFLPFFAKLECLPVSAESVKQWKGPLAFVHRFKIEMTRDFCSRFEGNVLYCDTDTYITAPLHDVFNDLSKNHFYMHQYEGVIDRSQSPSFHKWEKFLSTTPVDYGANKVAFSKTLRMYNAGVVGLNTANKALLDDVLLLSDAVYGKFPKHIAEQFAFSYCLQKKSEVKTADHVIAHYWNLKEFRQLLHTFFSRNQEESIPNLVKKIHHLDALAIMEQKITFESLPFLPRLFKKLKGTAWHISRYEKKW